MKWSRLDSWHIFLACYLLPILSMRWNLPSLVRVVALDYPLQTIILAFLLPILALAFTRPTSPARLAIIPVIAAAVVSYLQTAHMYISNNMLIAISSGPTTLLLLSSIDYLCLQELHRTKDGKEKSGNIEPQSHITSEKEAIPEPRADLFVDVHHALWWSTDVIFNYRGVGTARQVKNLPTFSRSDPDYVPSRSRFLFRRLVSVALGYIVVDFLNSQPPLNVNLFSASKARLFGGLLDLSLEDVAMRVATTLVFWLSLRLTIALIYNAASALFVGFWLSDPEQWPPYFGSVSDAYSVRRFWG